MCGIIGVVGNASRSLTSKDISRALDAIRHRGPDDEGYLFYSIGSGALREAGGADTAASLHGMRRVEDVREGFDVALAHRRLSVLDVSSAGHQPMSFSNARYWILFNGEIYNYIELRDTLSQLGHRFQTSTDTEVLLAAYAEWGTAMLPRLVGMFAVAILDCAANTLFLARDPFGIKPLYIARERGSLLFASEITPLLRLARSRPTADPSAVYQFMRFGVTDGHDATLFEGIRNFPAAHYAVYSASGETLSEPTPYWIAGRVAQRNISLSDAAAELRHLLDLSVRLQLRSDVPLGTCLSGGLDSTAIAASMRTQLGPDVPIHAFSFESNDPRTGEGPYVGLASRALCLERNAVSPTGEELLRDLEDLIRTQEQPFGSTSIYAQFRVFRLAHENGITVMLDGQGADELFGGYPTAISAQLAGALSRGAFSSLPKLWSSKQASAPGVRRRVLLSAAGRLLPAKLLPSMMALVGESLYPKWLNDDWFRNREHVARARPQGRGRNALREELLHFVRTLSLPQLLRYEDRNSMRFSIESRVPFCSTELADFAFSLPADLLVSPAGETKTVLRRAVEKAIPSDIISRPKVGFETPERAWLKSLLPWMQQTLNSDAFRSLPFLDHAAARERALSVINAREGPDNSVWRILNIAAWARQFEVGFAA